MLWLVGSGREPDHPAFPCLQPGGIGVQRELTRLATIIPFHPFLDPKRAGGYTHVLDEKISIGEGPLDGHDFAFTIYG